MLNAVLAAEVEFDAAAPDPGMAIAQGGQPEALVLTSIFGIPDTRERDLEQADEGGEDALTRQASKREIRLDAGADARQDAGEEQHAPVLRLVAHAAPARMIAVLLAAPRIAPDRLNMAVGIRADPNIGPGRRHRKRPDALMHAADAYGLPLQFPVCHSGFDTNHRSTLL